MIASVKKIMLTAALVLPAVAGYVLLTPSVGWAVACPGTMSIPATLQDYINLNASGGCTINDLRFDSFGLTTIVLTGPETAFLFPDNTLLNPGLIFPNIDIFNGANFDQRLEAHLGFTVSTISGEALIRDSSLALHDPSIVGTTRLDVNATARNGAGATVATLSTFVGNTGSRLSDEAIFSPVSSLSVATDFVVDAGPSSRLTLSRLSANFSEVAQVQVAEPTTLALTGTGLLTSALLRRRGRIRQRV